MDMKNYIKAAVGLMICTLGSAVIIPEVGFAEEIAEAETDIMDQSDSEESVIMYDKYPWGTSFEEIKSKEIKPDMVLNQDYGYYEDTTYCAKELVIDEEIDDTLYMTRYDFDENDELISVMPVLNQVLTDEEIANLFIDMAAQYTERYGEPIDSSDIFSEEEYGTIKDYAEALDSGDVHGLYIWTDQEGNQLVLSAYRGSYYIELVMIFSVKEYAMNG